MSETVAITGALSYTGKYATRLLLARGYRVRTLTHHPDRTNPFGDRIEIFPYRFDQPAELRRTLEGATTLINTYWIRFPHGGSTFEAAVHNSRTLIDCAKDAGVRRIVHVSIANPSLDSPLAYYKGKAEVEQALIHSGLSYAILRPTVIFGAEDILVNNIAWFVRRFPAFAIPGDGRYGIRSIYAEDMAQLLADSVIQTGDSIRDAVGPETFAFDDLVRLIAERTGRSIQLLHLPAAISYMATLATGWALKDIVLTWEEYKGLMFGLLESDAPSAGSTKLSEWLSQNSDQVGRNYASEVARHF